MAARLNELKQKRIEAKKRHSALVEQHIAACAAATPPRKFSEEENKAQAALKTEVADLDELITAQEAHEAEEKADAAARPSLPRTSVSAPNFEQDPAKGFRSHTEFFMAARKNSSTIRDERMKHLAVASDNEEGDNLGDGNTFMLPLAFTPPSLRRQDEGYQAAAGADEQGTYDDRYGGYAVGRTQLPGLLQIGFEGDPTAGRTQPLPMATPIVDMVARTDKDHTTSVSGGFTVSRSPETAAKGSSRAKMEMISLKATSVFGLVYVTEEQVTDSFISVVALIDAGFRDQFAHHMLNEKLRGGGGNEYLGILTALYSATPANSLGPTISIAKVVGQGAATIVYDNAVNMRSRCWGYGNAIWLANHDCYPQLSKLSVPIGVGGQLVYQQSLVEDRPDTLLGRPVFYTEYASTIGTQGDLILANWSQFLEGTYQPLQSAESVHVRFLNHERTFKFWLRNAGAPWWRVPITPFKGANTLSPFVVLDTRA